MNQESNLAVGKEESHSLHANLEEPPLTRLHVFDGELPAEVSSGQRGRAPGRRSLHRLLDGLVQLPTLPRVVLVQLRLASVPSPETDDSGLGAVGHVHQPLPPPPTPTQQNLSHPIQIDIQ